MEKTGIITLEKRRFPRLPDNIFISYRLKSRIFNAVTRNISGGGLMFEAAKKIPLGAELELEIYQPGNFFKTLIFVIPVLIEVIWCKKIKYGFLEEGENKYRLGISFIEIKDEDREKIVQYIKDKKR